MKQSFFKAVFLATAMMLSMQTMANEPQEQESIIGCDFMYVSGNKFCFYKIASRTVVEYKIEKADIFNYHLKKDRHSVFYTVCEGGKLIVKSVDFYARKPTPTVIAEWGLKCQDCITETYDTNSPLSVSADERYLGIQYEFSWDCYGFNKIKVYDTREKKFVETKDDDESSDPWHYFSYNVESGDDEDVEDYSITDKFQNYTEEGSNFFGFYYQADENTSICLNDKLNLEESGECYFNGVSPKKDRVLFSIVTGAGDFEHGPYAVSSLDGKNQTILKSTDMSVDGGISVAWLSDGSLLYTTNFDENITNFKPSIMYLPAGSWTPVKLLDASEFTLLK